MEEKGFTWLSVRLPTEKHEEIKARATRSGVSMSDIVRLALDGLVVVRGDGGATENQPAQREALYA